MPEDDRALPRDPDRRRPPCSVSSTRPNEGKSQVGAVRLPAQLHPRQRHRHRTGHAGERHPRAGRRTCSTARKEGSPFEIVAAQAMLARWVGVPVAHRLRLRRRRAGRRARSRCGPSTAPRFLEVYFPGYKWLPVIGTPKKAKPTVGTSRASSSSTQHLPSDDISVPLFLPVVRPAARVFGRQLRRALLIGIPVLLVLRCSSTSPVRRRKAIARSRRRNRRQRCRPAPSASPSPTPSGATTPPTSAIRIRRRHPADVPRPLPDDPEHTEFAWLVTRAMWGDLRDRHHPTMAHRRRGAVRARCAAAWPRPSRRPCGRRRRVAPVAPSPLRTGTRCPNPKGAPPCRGCSTTGVVPSAAVMVGVVSMLLLGVVRQARQARSRHSAALGRHRLRCARSGEHPSEHQPHRPGAAVRDRRPDRRVRPPRSAQAQAPASDHAARGAVPVGDGE